MSWLNATYYCLNKEQRNCSCRTTMWRLVLGLSGVSVASVVTRSCLADTSVPPSQNKDAQVQNNKEKSGTLEYPPNLILLQAQIVMRHGDRAPLGWVPAFLSMSWRCDKPMDHAAPASIVYSKELKKINMNHLPPETIDLTTHKEVCFPGQLTPKGKKQMRKLGVKFRERYINSLKLLDSDFNGSEIRVRSTPIPRTEESLQSVLNGMYPDQQYDIVIHTPSAEPMWVDALKCDRLEELLKEFKYAQREITKKKLQPLKEEMIHLLTQKDDKGQLPSGKHWPTQLFDVLSCLAAHSLLPEKVDASYMSRLEEVTRMHWFDPYSHPEISRLGIGRFVKEISDHIFSRANGDSDLKLILYSGHDTTVAPLLSALKVFDKKWPKTGCYVAFELFQEKNAPKNQYVRISYNDNVLHLPECKAFEKNGNGMCPLDKFREIVSQVIPKNLHKECKSPPDDM